MVEQARTSRLAQSHLPTNSSSGGGDSLDGGPWDGARAIMRPDVWVCVVWALLIGMCIGPLCFRQSTKILRTRTGLGADRTRATR